MTSDRKKPGVAFWASVVLVVALVGYPLSFGPAVWLAARGVIPKSPVKWAYWPMLCQRVHLNLWGPYGSLGIPRGESITFVVTDLEGDEISASFGGGDDE